MFGLSRLFRPFDYLRVKHEAKVKYDYIYPAIVSVGVAAIFFSAPHPIEILGQSGLVSEVSSLIAILAGFYIASLAAVATFNMQGMDKTMPGTPPVLDIHVKGKVKQLLLTRRRFLSLMFGYLAMMSVFIYILGAFVQVAWPAFKGVIDDNYVHVLRIVFVLLYLFMFSNVLITTFLGLFFMSDRIHRPDPNLKTEGPKDGRSASNLDEPA